MIFSESRYALFRIMLQQGRPQAQNFTLGRKRRVIRISCELRRRAISRLASGKRPRRTSRKFSEKMVNPNIGAHARRPVR